LEKKDKVKDYVMEILLGGILSPFFFGFLGVPFTGDFSGAGMGIFVMIFSWFLIFASIVFDF